MAMDIFLLKSANTSNNLDHVNDSRNPIGIKRRVSIILICITRDSKNLIFSAFVRNLNTSWMRELDICCVKDSELHIFTEFHANKQILTFW